MPSKGFFPNLWRRQHDGTGALEKAVKTETPVNNWQSHPAESLTGSQSNLLSYDDIYHAAGILTPRSGYGVRKVVDMLNSDRIRELSKDIQLASVLMALDAAGASPDDRLKDATHRQQALNSYEAGQQKQLEEFEERKAQENTKIRTEMDRVTTHYAERIKQNHDQVVREKQAMRNWQNGQAARKPANFRGHRTLRQTVRCRAPERCPTPDGRPSSSRARPAQPCLQGFRWTLTSRAAMAGQPKWGDSRSRLSAGPGPELPVPFRTPA